MPLLQVFIVLIVVGVLLWLVNSFIPMQRTIKSTLNAMAIIVAALVPPVDALIQAEKTPRFFLFNGFLAQRYRFCRLRGVCRDCGHTSQATVTAVTVTLMGFDLNGGQLGISDVSVPSR